MRSVHTLWSVTSAAGGAVTTGVIDVSGYDSIQVDYRAAGAAAPAVSDVQIYADDGVTLIHTDALTIGIAGQGSLVYGCESQQPAGATVVNAGPVPRLLVVRGTGGAASTVTVNVLGIRRETQIRG